MDRVASVADSDLISYEPKLGTIIRLVSRVQEGRR